MSSAKKHCPISNSKCLHKTTQLGVDMLNLPQSFFAGRLFNANFMLKVPNMMGFLCFQNSSHYNTHKNAQCVQWEIIETFIFICDNNEYLSQAFNEFMMFANSQNHVFNMSHVHSTV